jgi:pimeloyl-ACP methyl ester carboxylesterase
MHTLRQRVAHRAYCLPAAAAAACSALARALPPLPALALGTGAAAAAAALSAAALSRCSALPTSLRAAAAPLQASASGAAAAARGLPAALLAGAGWRETPRAEAAAACEALLRTAVGTPFTTYTLGGLYTVELAAPRAGAPVLVMLSGYSSGAGLFYPSLDRLAQHYHVHCVDVLGTGASERPPFTAQTAEEGEAFFLHALEQWRALRFPAPPSTGSGSSSSSSSSTSSSPPLTLLGHSLGGYLAAAYALRHPQAVAHLILVNAAGIPAQADGRIAAARARHWVVGALGWAWEAGVTPGALVRALGPAGSTLVEGIVQRRFGGATPPELARYVHAIMSAQGSGEYALSRLLNFGAHAKAPLGPRLLEGWRGRTTVLHGARDWMDLRASAALVGGLRERGVDAAFVTVAGAEHYVFMERPEAFAAALVQRG